MKSFLFLIVTLGLTACSPTHGIRGNLVEEYRLAQLQPGQSTPSDVMTALGSPTTTDPFNTNIWYYIGQKIEKKGIFDPEVTEERVIRVTFDPKTQLLAEVTPLQTARNDIPIARDVTPTSGNEMNAVQQMVGNIGKFNKAQSAANPAR